jgi:hypothetical protein
MSTMGTSTATTAQPTAATTPTAANAAKKQTNPLQPSYIPTQQFNPQQTLKQILAGFQPQARQQQGALNSQLAAAGIVGGGAQSADQLLAAQQSSALAPTLASAIQGSQGMQLTADEANQQAANASRSQLANYLMQAWQIPYQATAGLAGSALSGFGGLAGQEAQNFAVPPPQTILSMLGLT